MSLAIRAHRARVMNQFNARYRGDPGLFSFLGGVAKGVVGAVAGAGIPIVSNVAKGVQTVAGWQQVPISQAAAGAGPGMQQLPQLQAPMGQAQLPTPGVVGWMQRALPGGASGYQAVPGTGVCAIKGTHLNRSDYHLKDGTYVAEGTRCVKNRRMNPLNPRALSRSMQRIVSAKRAARFLDKIHIGARPARRRAAGGCCPPKRKCR